ncbi:MAG: HD domain-containing protein [Candidatus Heimdallarchaeota archaeon]|nr:HD domain-containing protein [Candidatus Heimdallarchaeota archaeon]
MNEEEFIEFFTQIEKLKTTIRHSWTSDKNRKESTAEHSWMLSMLALISLPKLGDNVDGLRILKLSIVHDFTEALAGDIPTHDQTDADDKQKNERAAKEKMLSNLPDDIAKEIDDLWEEYEAQETRESKIVKALDKIEVGFQHNTADFSTWNDEDKGYPINYAEKYSEIDPFLKELNRINMNWRKKKLSDGK